MDWTASQNVNVRRKTVIMSTDVDIQQKVDVYVLSMSDSTNPNICLSIF